MFVCPGYSIRRRRKNEEEKGEEDEDEKSLNVIFRIRVVKNEEGSNHCNKSYTRTNILAGKYTNVYTAVCNECIVYIYKYIYLL